MAVKVREVVTGDGVRARAWAMEVADVAAALAVDSTVGLTPADAEARVEELGPNELAETARRSSVALFAAQFTNTMTVVLIAAGFITALIGDRKDAVVITAIVIVNAVVGFVQEHQAEQAMVALRKMTAELALVRRDGDVLHVPTASLVPGDVVMLATGDVVPADLRLLESVGLRVNEAALTGESEAVAKHVRRLEHADALSDRHNLAFKGTAVTSGRGVGLVVGTGMSTELGRIATLLQAGRSGSTPLQRRLAQLGRRMAAGAVVVCAVAFGVGVAAGEPAEDMFLVAVSLAVAAVPESLPAVVTVALALGARRMAERRAIVRKLPAVEALGSVTVICTDKTGTLTQNQMFVERVWAPDVGDRVVRGDGYTPAGEVDGPPAEGLSRLGLIAAACNDSLLHAPENDGPWTLTGDPTEGALLALSGKLTIDGPDVSRPRPRAIEIAFDADRRRMTTAHCERDGRVWVASKGALDALAPHLGDGAELGEAREVAAAWASAGYRVLALADRRLPSLPDRLDDLEHDLRLAGLVAMADPPRPEVRAAIAACHSAGITPVVITGDDPRTGTAIARRLGILDTDGDVITGAELDELDDDALCARVDRIAVYARASPEQKLRIIDAWKARGAVVAMTGDGVNDAPALRRADVGVAMGITGTDVSKDAADVVLADDNFATIVDAIAEGRRIYDNLRRFVRYLLTTNTGEIWLMIAAPVLGLPIPLLPLQLLWVNLVTDGLPAVALGLEPAEPDVMRRPPRRPTESIFARGLWQHALWVGILMAGVGLAVQATARAAGWEWRTMVFTTTAFLQLGHALAIRSERQSLRSMGLFSNWRLLAAVAVTILLQLVLVYFPPLHDWFGTAALGPAELGVTLAASTTVLLAVEGEKLVRRRALAHGGQRAQDGGHGPV
jgi:Ca2+-transporting ATPase